MPDSGWRPDHESHEFIFPTRVGSFWLSNDQDSELGFGSYSVRGGVLPRMVGNVKKRKGMSMYWVCKMCGRSIRQEQKPMCCYFDRMDAIEDISDEDAVKMGLNIPEGERFEFPGDVQWDPITGVTATATEGPTLKNFQRSIMERVRG